MSEPGPNHPLQDDWRILAAGEGWRVIDAVCRAGPEDRPFEEAHDFVCVAAVTEGTFNYRTRSGRAALAPGGVLLGELGACYQCGHEHGRGDRCIAFHFAPSRFEAILAATPGARDIGFGHAHLPPLTALAPLMAEAEAAREDGDGAALQEIGLRMASGVASLINEALPARRFTARDHARISEAVRRIERDAHEALSLDDLADEAGMDPFAFLRAFKTIIGMTPHQFVLRTRMHRAAVRLRRSRDTVSDIAFDAGFGDLSTFNRRFKRVMGSSPTAFRAQARA
ncbi:transcriptional regulator of AraC family [alpha proteobacterium U9-1i]|nr:transcriptional regulator of AraC family [alpha proteobacterium U9-1i]